MLKMNRALVPCGALAGVSFLSWNWFKQEAPQLAAQALVHIVKPHWIAVVNELLPGGQWFQSVWTIGGAFILWHSWREVVWIVQALLGVLYWLICLIGASLEFVTRSWQRHLAARFKGGGHTSFDTAAEQGVVFTWQAMAVVPGAAPLPLGTFVLVSRPPLWDEVLVTGFSDDQSVALCRTTTPDGGDWAWVLVQVNGLHMRVPPVAGDGTRSGPGGVDPNQCNWICIPPAGVQQWKPSAADLAQLSLEANMILGQLRASPNGWTLNHPGVAGDLQPMAVPPPGPIAPGGAGGAAAAVGAQPVVPALGVGGGSDPASTQVDLKALESAVNQLQAMALSPASSSRKKDKDKKRKKDKKSKKKKKKKSRSSTSSNSSSSSRSRSNSSASSEDKKKPLRWKEDGKDRRVPLSSLTHVDQLKLKKRGDLVSFAARHPGALTAHFLASVYSRLSKGALTRSGQLREVSVTAWAQQFSGLTEIRDMKEVVTLAEILDSINRKEISQALDILSQRILAIQSAKSKGGSWEKAEAIELVDNRRSLASTSMLALTNA